MRLPAKGNLMSCGFETLTPLVGSKAGLGLAVSGSYMVYILPAGVRDCEKSPLRSSSVGTEPSAGRGSFCRYFSMAKVKKVRSLPLYTRGRRTGPFTTKPYWSTSWFVRELLFALFTKVCAV